MIFGYDFAFYEELIFIFTSKEINSCIIKKRNDCCQEQFLKECIKSKSPFVITDNPSTKGNIIPNDASHCKSKNITNNVSFYIQ